MGGAERTEALIGSFRRLFRWMEAHHVEQISASTLIGALAGTYPYPEEGAGGGRASAALVKPQRPRSAKP
eukprot:1183486-Prorocentrum_minimum.AAC.2